MEIHTVCHVLPDHKVMRLKMQDRFFCPDKTQMGIDALRARVKARGYHVTSTNNINFRTSLSPCQSCYNYTGDYEGMKYCFKLK